MTDAMDAEFDTVASWTVDAVADLGPDHALPAACRGSGGPTTLSWFLDRLEVGADDTMLDCGGGMGGPAAYAAQTSGVRPVVTDPEPGACTAARRLFDLSSVQAGSRLPFGAQTFDVAWSLGVLCTVDDQLLLLRELRRVLTPDGRLGLLVYVRVAGPDGDAIDDQPIGNNFPTPADLDRLLTRAGLDVIAPPRPIDTAPPSDWSRLAAEVTSEVGRRHADDERWRLAEDQQARMTRVLESGQVRPEAVIARSPIS